MRMANLLLYAIGLGCLGGVGCADRARESCKMVCRTFDNGNTYRGVLVNGLKEGYWEHRDAHGNALGVEGYRHNKEHGKYLVWDSDGLLVVDNEYRNGERWRGKFRTLINERVYDPANPLDGPTISHIVEHYTAGKRDGLAEAYSGVGKPPIYVGEYRNGRPWQGRLVRRIRDAKFAPGYVVSDFANGDLALPAGMSEESKRLFEQVLGVSGDSGVRGHRPQDDRTQ